jgi:ribonucleoside-diphosphate reductase beta chain
MVVTRLVGTVMPIDYSQREKSFELYRKGKREGTWDPDDYDFSQDVEDWQAFTEDEQRQFLSLASGFYDGEENVTRTLAPYMTALDALDDDRVPFDTVQEEVYLSQQVYEEAKHTDLFSRYYEEVFGTHDTASYRQEREGYGTEDLFEQANDLLAAVREGDQRNLIHTLAEAYLNYMGIVEAQLARSGYMSFDQMCEIKAEELGREMVLPGFQESMGKVRQDETRHIENGRWMLQQFAEADPDVVTEVYEPRLDLYVETRVLGDNVFAENVFEGYDRDTIGKKTIQHLQDTVDYIGAEKFDRFADVGVAIETMRAEGGDAAAAGDDD